MDIVTKLSVKILKSLLHVLLEFSAVEKSKAGVIIFLLWIDSFIYYCLSHIIPVWCFCGWCYVHFWYPSTLPGFIKTVFFPLILHEPRCKLQIPVFNSECFSNFAFDYLFCTIWISFFLKNTNYPWDGFLLLFLFVITLKYSHLCLFPLPSLCSVDLPLYCFWNDLIFLIMYFHFFKLCLSPRSLFPSISVSLVS